MSTKDYVRIARAIKEARLVFDTEDISAQLAITSVVSKLLVELHDDNERFDAIRFIDASNSGR